MAPEGPYDPFGVFLFCLLKVSFLQMLTKITIEKEETTMTMIKKTICTISIIGIFVFVLFIVTAQAQQPVDCLVCQYMTMTTIVESGDLIIMGFEAKGIVLDNTESKFLVSFKR